jgi:hypothetical protein
MILELKGNYFLKLQIAGNILQLQPQMIKEVSITQDIDRFLPTFRIAFQDPGGLLTNVLPYDGEAGKISLEIGSNLGSNLLNRFEFKVLRRTPSASGIFEMSGLLNTPGLFDCSYSRGWNDKIKSVLQSIAQKDLDIDKSDCEIDEALNVKKNLIQPNWTNAKFLNYLKANLCGNSGQAGFYCFVKNILGKPKFVFRSLDNLFSGPTKYNFIVGEEPMEDHFPILETSVIDNSTFLSSFGSSDQNYGYFDFEQGKFVSGSVSIDDCPSISEYFLVHKNSCSTGQPFYKLGRENDFQDCFSGKIKNTYYSRMSNLIHMWATTWGLENIAPGDIVRVVFGEELKRGKMYVYQHSGYWMVKRVVHLIDTTFCTKLLLTRGGIDTSMENLLTVSQNRKKR